MGGYGVKTLKGIMLSLVAPYIHHSSKYISVLVLTFFESRILFSSIEVPTLLLRH
jgi:hypothetical protein